MKFKEVYGLDGSDLTLGPFFMTDVRKIAKLIENDLTLCLRNDNFGDLRQYLTSRVRARNSLYFAVRQKKKVLGYTALDPYDPVCAQVLNWAKSDIEFGLLNDCAKLLFNYAFDVMNLNKLVSGVIDVNKAGLVHAKRLGMTHEGILREQTFVDGAPHDVHVYSILRREFKCHKQSHTSSSQ